MFKRQKYAKDGYIMFLSFQNDKHHSLFKNSLNKLKKNNRAYTLSLTSVQTSIINQLHIYLFRYLYVFIN